MTSVSYEVLEAHDRRLMAFHECGHAVVARHYGLTVFPRIWRAEIDADVDESFSEKQQRIWRGRTEIWAGKKTPSITRQVSMAGVLAETIMRNGSSPEFGEADLEDRMRVATEEDENFGEPEEWSPTDWQHAKDWTSSDVHAVYTILLENWDTLSREAEYLIEMGKHAPAAFRLPTELMREGVSTEETAG